MYSDKTDADGRHPLSQREYNALRTFFGFISALEACKKELEPRLRDIQDGWEELAKLDSMACSLLDKMLDTIPFHKLRQIQLENEISRVEVVPKGGCAIHDDAYVCIPAKALEEICNEAISIRCFGCTTSHAASSHCGLRKAIDATLPYDAKQTKNLAKCPYNGLIGLEDEI